MLSFRRRLLPMRYRGHYDRANQGGHMDQSPHQIYTHAFEESRMGQIAFRAIAKFQPSMRSDLVMTRSIAFIGSLEAPSKTIPTLCSVGRYIIRRAQKTRHIRR